MKKLSITPLNEIINLYSEKIEIINPEIIVKLGFDIRPPRIINTPQASIIAEM